MSEHEPRAGRVAIVGRPNVGKSTLLNALLGQKLAIVTARPGTTRTCLLGVFASDDPPTQIAFVDTPGLERPRSVLGRALHEEAKGSLEDVDAVLVLIDASRKGAGNDPVAADDAAILEQAIETGRPVVLALNKVDKVKDKGRLLPMLATYDQRFALAALVPLSALKQENLEPLTKELRQVVPEGVLYPPDFLTDRPTRFLVAELVREALMRHTREEVPYAIAVQIERYSEDTDVTRIEATIVVDRSSHKGIVIGSGGERLKKVGTEARQEIEELVQRKVFLKLFVKVDEDWTRDPGQVRRLTREEH